MAAKETMSAGEASKQSNPLIYSTGIHTQPASFREILQQAGVRLHKPNRHERRRAAALARLSKER